MNPVATRDELKLSVVHSSRGLLLVPVTLTVLMAVALGMPAQFVVLTIAAAAFLFSVLRVDAFLYAIVLFLPITPVLPTGFGNHDISSLVRIMMFLGVCARLFVERRRFQARLIADRLSYLAIGVGVISLLSVVANPLRMTDEAVFLRLVSYLCFYFSMIAWLRTERQIRIVIGLLMLSTIIVSLFGFVQAAIGGYTDLYFWLYPDQAENSALILWSGRITSFLNHFNTLAAYLNLVLPLAVASAVIRIGRSLRLLAICCLVTATIAVILTQSRGGLVAFGGTALVVLFLLGRNSKNIKTVLVTVLLTVVVALPFASAYSNRFATLEDDQSGVMRLVFWDAAWGMFRSSPLIGVGYGNFVKLFDGDSLGLEPGRFDVHNLYLETLAETGVLGFVLFVLLLIGALRAAWKQVQQPLSDIDIVIGVAASGAVVSILIHGFVDTLLDLPQCGALLWMILGIFVANKQLRDSVRQEPSVNGNPVKSKEMVPSV
jgi:putative inorganic carbon (hco3(-)) transporter